MAEARDAKRPVFIDFYAEWCAPCKIIEGKILPDSRVQAALDGFIFVRVDMDIDLKAGQRFNVAAMPTLQLIVPISQPARSRPEMPVKKIAAHEAGTISRPKTTNTPDSWTELVTTTPKLA